MDIKQISQLDTGINTNRSREADQQEKLLIEKRPKNANSIFVCGNKNSGTRWLNYLIIQNTPSDTIYTLRNQHYFFDDDNYVCHQNKHSILYENILQQKNNLIIFVIRDFESWLPSFLSNPYGSDIQSNTVYDESMTAYINIYRWYCNKILINIDKLKNSECNYILLSLKQVQQDNGISLLKLLETYGYKLINPYKLINKHVKSKKKNKFNRKYSKFNINYYRIELNHEIEMLFQKLEEFPIISINSLHN